MKRFLLAGWMLFAGLSLVNAQSKAAPKVVWNKNFGGSDGDVGFRIEKTLDGGYILGGQSSSLDGEVTGVHTDPEFPIADLWLVKLDANFNITWEKAFGGSGFEDFYDMALTKDGGYVMVAYTDSYDGDVTDNHGDPNDYYGDAWVIKVDKNGNKEWARCVGGLKGDLLRSITTDQNGNFILVGMTNSEDGDIVTPNKGHNDLWVVKMDPKGNVISSRTYGGSSSDEAYSVQMLANGNYIVAGRTYSANGDITHNYGTPGQNSDIWIIEFNPAGDIVWQKTYGSSVNDSAWKVLPTKDGGLLVGGYALGNDGTVTETSYGATDYYVMKLDAQHNIQWQKKYGGSFNDNLFNMVATPDNNFLLIGSSISNDHDVSKNYGEFDMWLVKIDSQGKMIWEKNVGSSGSDSTTDALYIDDENFLVFGYTSEADNDVTNTYGQGDFWIAKLNDKKLATAETTKSKIKIYPNPTSDFVNIENYSKSEILTAELYDMTGRLIQKIKLDGTAMDIRNLKSGAYLLKIADKQNNISTHQIIKK